MLIVQGSLHALDLPVERLGYTYIVCAAGGSLVWDADTVPAVVEQRQSVSTDLRRISRTFEYSTVVRSTVNPAVVRRCGSVIEMNVRRSVAGCEIFMEFSLRA